TPAVSEPGAQFPQVPCVYQFRHPGMGCQRDSIETGPSPSPQPPDAQAASLAALPDTSVSTELFARGDVAAAAHGAQRSAADVQGPPFLRAPRSGSEAQR